MPEQALTLKWDSRTTAFLESKAIQKAVTRAVTKAGGKAARLLKSGSSKLIRQRKRFKASKINKAFKLIFPRGRKDLANLVWRLDVPGRPVPLIDLRTRQTKQGVKVSVNVGKWTLLKHAFIATMKSGHKGVFQRLSGKRLPIREAFTTRLTDPFEDSDFVPFVQAGAQAFFQSSFDRLLPLELGKID